MIGRRKLAIGAAGAAVALAVPMGLFSGGGTIDVFVGSTPTPTGTPTATPTATPGSITCDRTATSTATLSTQVTAATTGQTICLTAATTYTFNGTTKAITIIAQNGSGTPSPVAATVDFGTFNTGPASGTLVIDGGLALWNSATAAQFNGGDFGSSIKNVTFQNFKDTSPGDKAWNFDPAPCNANVKIDHGHFYNGIVGASVVYFGHSAAEPCSTGITVQRSLFRHFSADAIRFDGDNGGEILRNKFMDFRESNGQANHTDIIQGFSGNGIHLKGNWFYDFEQASSAFDGTGNNVFEHNAYVGVNTAHWITLMGDRPGSTVKFNTITDGVINCDSKSGLLASLTSIYNNFASDGVALNAGSAGPDCTPTRNDHNWSTSPTYAGGSNPSLFDKFSDFCLTGPSGAMTAADDGGPVGVCGESFNPVTGGPPAGEGY